MDQIYSVTEVAERLGVSIPTILLWLRDGIFPHAFKLNPRRKSSPYRIPESDIVAFEQERIASQPGNLTQETQP
jgi:excisionase family DNA binding protein